ncbi:MAG: putative addiction module antidote protein [Campylobacteraceae bacterium]|jgi:probable addiction module antidote protein|nr:putative addiction module antidote protein [Campylobacteraceae bacterium]
MKKYKYIKEGDANLSPFDTDVSKELTDDETIEGYLNYILEQGDEADLKRALGHIAKAKGMTTVAKEVGTTREGLYKSFDGQTKVQLDTFMKLIKSFGLTIRFAKA